MLRDKNPEDPPLIRVADSKRLLTGYASLKSYAINYRPCCAKKIPAIAASDGRPMAGSLIGPGTTQPRNLINVTVNYLHNIPAKS
jgi:hypothetical protein